MNSGDRSILTGKDLPPKGGHKDSSLKDNASSGNLMMINGPKEGSLWVFTGSHEQVFYGNEAKIKKPWNMCLEKVIMPPFYIF